ncbi:tetratricopeptide repeat protein [Desulfobacterales bacterium HSG2]|nr:tetratricopeptide repeat protein [Desulfobacterales bacterium HSG2]
MKLLPLALGGEKYSTLRAARLPLTNVPDTSDFIGRQQELKKLEKALDDHKILVIEGLTGVGKSMLAARLAKRVRRRFEDRVVWISLNQGEEYRGKEKRHIIFDALLKQLAAFFESQRDDSVEAIRTRQGAKLHTKFEKVIKAMCKITCLIVLDEFQFALNQQNEISEKNVQNFINALLNAEFPSRIILTSRYHPKLNERYKGRYYAKEIKGLSNTEGRDLLRHLQLNADGRTLENICRKVKGHPFALKIFTTLAEKLPAEEVLKGDYFGKRCSKRLLKEVYETVLSEEEQRLMIDASVYRRPVPFKGLLVFESSDELIESLSNKFLFEFDADSQHYSQHPIVTDFAYHQLKSRSGKHLKYCHVMAAGFYEKLLNQQSGKATLEVVQNYIERHHHYRQTGDLEKTIETALDSFDELRVLAKEYYKSKEFEGAEKAYQAALEMDSMNAEANFYYALLLDKRNVEFATVDHHFREVFKHNYTPYYVRFYGEFLGRRGKIKEARNCFEKGLRRFRKDYALYNVYAQFEIENNRKDRAIEVYKRGIPAFPKTAQFCLKCSELLLKRGNREDMQEAVEMYKQGIKANPYENESYLAYGTLLQKLGEDEEAKRIYEQGLKTKPDSGALYLAYGTLLQKLGEDEEAKRVYEQGSKTKPDSELLFVAYGTLLQKLGEDEEAKRIYEQELKTKPDSEVLSVAYGTLLQKLGEDEEAKRVYEQGLKTKLDSGSLYLAYGILLQKLGEDDEARRVYEQGLKTKPDLEALYLAYGTLLQKLGEDDEARRVYDRGLKAKPESFLSVFCNFVFDFKWREKYQEVEVLLQKALNKNPVDSSANANHARLKAIKNEPEAAEELFKKAIENSKVGYVFCKYAEFLHQQGRSEEAIVICQKGLDVSPENEYLLKLLHELEKEKLHTGSPLQDTERTTEPSQEKMRHEEEHPDIDVLIITALKDELDELLKCRGESGKWQDHKDRSGYPYHTQKFRHEDGTLFTVAAARSLGMGEAHAAAKAASLIKELEPCCVAMVGICAGNPEKVFLGDVIVADRVFKIDGGKLKASEQDGIRVEDDYHDIITHNLDTRWKLLAEDFSREWIKTIRRKRPKSYAHQERWVLHTLYASEDENKHLREHNDRASECPDWDKTIRRLIEQRLVKVPEFQLTSDGADRVESSSWKENPLEPDPAELKVHIGPMGTTGQVQQVPELFSKLERLTYKILGVEMESSAIGIAAEGQNIQMIMVKGVSDYGDLDKNDQFRHYAAEASARFLVEFMKKTDIIPKLRKD